MAVHRSTARRSEDGATLTWEMTIHDQTGLVTSVRIVDPAGEGKARMQVRSSPTVEHRVPPGEAELTINLGGAQRFDSESTSYTLRAD